ncbi:MAG: response regulator transcription factor [Clostridiales bacterium]|nr:response regulator transcription factor [Clostridiales bacterium]MBR4010275.1 response regulator transcription factor [Clostridiales bacterium]
MARVLIVEDAEALRELIAEHFRETGAFEVDAAKDGNEGLRFVSASTYDIAILDIMLPGPSGFDICKILRRKSNCPIVFLTALGNEDNILKGYALGADEYMVKPFSIKVLYAKCLALLARATEPRVDETSDTQAGKSGEKEEKILLCGGIALNPSRMEVLADGEEVVLAPKEYFLLKVLMENQGRVLGRQKLLDLVWGMDFDGGDRVVDNHIKKLRKSLGSSGGAIKTVIGGGYKITC